LAIWGFLKMPSWFSPLWDFLKDPGNQQVITWLGGGIAAIAGGIWVVIKFFAERKNTDLMRNILEQGRMGPQAPGSQQAFAKAFDATAKDAKAGKPRAKQALEFLNAGKTEEAIPLFQAEAAEKEEASRSSAKEAADAYRNLGGIVGLANPKRALEAYEKAVELNPDDLDTCIGQAGFRYITAISTKLKCGLSAF
jgi:tetratricopeptide (TPR) repeat protein